eukprot:TRINITY_DN60981_c0_g2_i2.p1 TRINITY_DN60981_c0_g2~~TRINITY_DN60981_c0_g2_i2.p1  ORF type:complete len:240 (-),score=16.73 TRINITY_DN60981_c0_g2_i2:96-815(-)
MSYFETINSQIREIPLEQVYDRSLPADVKVAWKSVFSYIVESLENKVLPDLDECFNRISSREWQGFWNFLMKNWNCITHGETFILKQLFCKSAVVAVDGKDTTAKVTNDPESALAAVPEAIAKLFTSDLLSAANSIKLESSTIPYPPLAGRHYYDTDPRTIHRENATYLGVAPKAVLRDMREYVHDGSPGRMLASTTTSRDPKVHVYDNDRFQLSLGNVGTFTMTPYGHKFEPQVNKAE